MLHLGMEQVKHCKNEATQDFEIGCICKNPSSHPSSHPSDVDLKVMVARQVSKLEIDAIDASYRMRG